MSCAQKGLNFKLPTLGFELDLPVPPSFTKTVKDASLHDVNFDMQVCDTVHCLPNSFPFPTRSVRDGLKIVTQRVCCSALAEERKGYLEQLESPALLQLLEDDLQVPEAAPGLLHVHLKGLPREELPRVGKVLLEREERLQQTSASYIIRVL